MLKYVPMKKTLIVILLILGLIITMVPPIFAAEPKTNLTSINEVNSTLSRPSADTIVEAPGILPANPFYFLKNYVQGIRKALTFSAFSKARYEMALADEKMAELIATVSIDGRNLIAIATAVNNYGANIIPLEERVMSMKEWSNNTEAETIFRNLNAEMERHRVSLLNLAADYPELLASINDALVLVDGVLAQIPSKSFKTSK